jgi:hypothetical protein
MGENPSYMQTFKMPETNACIELISSNLKQLEDLISEREVSRPRITEAEVSSSCIESVNIEAIMDKIASLEALVQEQTTSENVQNLLEAYSAGIEYFSAKGDPTFDELLKRMHEFLNNEEIVNALREEKPTEAKESIAEIVPSSDTSPKETVEDLTVQESIEDSNQTNVEPVQEIDGPSHETKQLEASHKSLEESKQEDISDETNAN